MICSFSHFRLQTNIYQRLKTKNYPDEVSSEYESSGSISSVYQRSISDDKLFDSHLATVDATHNKTLAPPSAVGQSQKSDSDDGDFEIVNKTDYLEKMENNGNENDASAAVKQTVGEDAEASDKFPQQMANSKKSNWNTMELGEKRKRLRLVYHLI